MHAIDEATIERTWGEITAYDPEEALEKMELLTEEQSALFAMMLAQTEDMNDDAKELALYLFFMVHAIFRGAYGQPIPEIPLEEILAEQQQTQQWLDTIDATAEENFSERVIDEESRQPCIMQFVIEALVAASEGEDPIEITDDEQSMLYLALRSVVALFDRATLDVV